MTSKKNLVFFILVFISITTWSQNRFKKEKSDSLWAAWNNPTINDTSRMRALDNLIWDEYLFSQPDSALHFANVNCEFADRVKNKKFQAIAINTKGISYYVQGQLEKAKILIEQSIDINESIGNYANGASGLNNLGAIYYSLDDFRGAIACHEKRYEFSKKANDPKGKATSIFKVGKLYSIIGEHETAINNFTVCLKEFKKLKDTTEIARTYNDVAIDYRALGQYEKSINYANKAMEIMKNSSDTDMIATSLMNIGITLGEQGDYDQQYKIYKKCLSILLEYDNLKYLGLCYNNLGVNLFNKGQHKEAFTYFEKNLAIQTELDNQTNISTAYNNMAIFYVEIGNLEKGLIYHQKSLAIRESIELQDDISSSLNNISIIYQKQKKYKQAIRKSTLSLAIANKINYSNQIRATNKTLLQLYLAVDSVKKSKSTAQRLLSLRLEDLKNNFPTLTEKQKAGYFDLMKEDFDLIYDFAFYYPKHEEFLDYAYNNALLTKGLLLKSSTAMRQSIMNSGNQTLIQQYYDWIDLRKKIAQAYASGVKYDSIETEARSLEKELAKSSKSFSELINTQKINWKDVQKNLNENEVAIEIIRFDHTPDFKNESIKTIQYIALIIDNQSKHPSLIPLFEEKKLKQILGQFPGNNLSYINQTYGTQKNVKNELYKLIWEPINAEVKGKNKVYISLDGLLHKVSMSALASKKDVFLCNLYQLHYFGSTGQLNEEKKSKVELENIDALLIGGVEFNSDTSDIKIWNYLEGSLSETTEIEKLFKENKLNYRFYSKNDATEDIFKKQAVSTNMIHVATHGFFFPDPEKVDESFQKNESYIENINFRNSNISEENLQRSTRYAQWNFIRNKNPLMRSGIALANANDVWQISAMQNKEDGVLTAQEVSNLDLNNTQLVVLSACETGLGDIKGSEGVFGLQRAFKIAGAKSLIMSLWKVPDRETSEFMQLFYKNLIDLGSIEIAFQKTQETMREKYDPYFWAAFVLIH